VVSVVSVSAGAFATAAEGQDGQVGHPKLQLYVGEYSNFQNHNSL